MRAILLCVGYLGVAQLVARYLGVVEAAGSSPVTQTKKTGFLTPFFFVFCPFLHLLDEFEFSRTVCDDGWFILWYIHKRGTYLF